MVTRTLNSFLIIFGILFSSSFAYGQDSLKQISFGLNYARHGSGDMDGILVSFDFKKFYNRRITIIYGLGYSIHGQKAYPGSIAYDPTIPSDLQTDVPRWVTAGLQLSGLFSYNFSNKRFTGFNIAAGPVFRYQLNSYPNGYNYYGTQNGWFRQPFYVIRETDNNIFNIGYTIRISYEFKPIKRNVIGINSFYQNDTNADNLIGFGLIYGFLYK